MKINTDTHYLFRMTNMEMNINTDTHYLFRMKTWKMKINTDTHYLFRMTNMEDEDKHRYTLLIQDDKHGR